MALLNHNPTGQKGQSAAGSAPVVGYIPNRGFGCEKIELSALLSTLIRQYVQILTDPLHRFAEQLP